MGLESTVENHGITYAESLGFETRKMKYAGVRGCRDRDFYGFGHTLKVEFKKKDKDRDALQLRDWRKLKPTGIHIYVIDSKEKIEALLDWAKENPITETVCPHV